MSKTIAKDLTQGKVLTQLMTFAFPIVLANLLQIVYTMVDTVIVGRFIGTAGISAVSAASNIIMLCTNFSMGITSAGQVIISQFLGRNERHNVSRAIGTMFTVVITVALGLTVIALPLTKPLLNLVNTPSEAMSMAIDYAACSFAGMVFVFGYSAVGSMLRGLGDGKHPLIFIAIATVLNLVLDIIFVGPLKMGTLGAALATVMGQGVSFLFSLGYLFKHKEAFGFDFKMQSFKPDTAILKMFVKLGFPMALQYVAVNISTIYVASCINSYGVVISAVTGIGDKLRMVIAIFAASIGTAASTMVGQNFGAGKHDRVKKIYLETLGVLLVMCAVLGGAGIIFSKTVFGLFDTNAEVLAMASKFMVINCVTYMAFALYQPFSSLIHGMGYASFALINGLIDGFVARIGLVWLLGTALGFGFWGVWWGAAISAYVGAILGTIYFLTGRWRTYKPITDK